MSMRIDTWFNAVEFWLTSFLKDFIQYLQIQHWVLKISSDSLGGNMQVQKLGNLATHAIRSINNLMCNKIKSSVHQ